MLVPPDEWENLDANLRNVAADRFFQGPQLLACLFADEESVMHEWILADTATPGYGMTLA